MKVIYYITFLFFIVSCQHKKEVKIMPWEEVKEEEVKGDNSFSLNDIINNGELIIATLTGPDSYYEYRGESMGTQYFLCEKFAQNLRVSIRVELCKDTIEMIDKLQAGDVDLIAYFLPKSFKELDFCGPNDTNKQWSVKYGNRSLKDTLNKWFSPKMLAKIREEENFYFSTHSITRHIYSPMLDRSKGIISQHDHLFQKYAPAIRWDWRLLAAQAYQESTFDPKAKSWAGARGIMQIMPSTAKHLQLPQSLIEDPDANIAAATKYIRELDNNFYDITDKLERVRFVLASYNGGIHHVRDAMELAKKNGQNHYKWAEVSPYILGLSTPRYYNDPVVKYGYMRGSETVDYVSKIEQRWNTYRGIAPSGVGGGGTNIVPQKATKKYRFQL